MNFIQMKQFVEKESFSHDVLKNLRNGPWIALIACANFLLETYLYEIPRPGVSLVKAWEINLVFNLVLAWKFRKIE